VTPLRQFMQEHGLDNKTMAALAGVTIRTIVNWGEGHKSTPLAVQMLMLAVKCEFITLDWWREAAKATNVEQPQPVEDKQDPLGR
jgi:DNA-binding XRE family transcriptional regulator